MFGSSLEKGDLDEFELPSKFDDVTKFYFPLDKKNKDLKVLMLLKYNLDFKQLDEILKKIPKDHMLEKVVKISVGENNLTDLKENVLNLPNLQIVDLSYNKFSKFPKILCSIQHLTELDFSGNFFENLKSFPEMKNLSSLRIGKTILKDLGEFKKFPNLKKLFIFELDINSLKSLPPLKNLENLDLDNCKLTSLEDMPDLPNLKWLLARSNGIIDLKGIEKCMGLEFLFLAENFIETIENVSSLKNLKWIILGNNKLKSLKGLEMLDKLEQVIIDNNLNLKDFSPLYSCTSLQKLSMINIIKELDEKEIILQKFKEISVIF